MEGTGPGSTIAAILEMTLRLAASTIDTFSLAWEEADLDCATVPRLYSIEAEVDEALPRAGFAADVASLRSMCV